LCFSVVYVPEFVLMGRTIHSRFSRLRPLVFLAGTLIGMLLSYGVANEMYWIQYASILTS
jgi:hypothetical protein